MDKGKDSIEIEISPARDCRVAYTINNKQSVRSTYIGDQPLFYMDCDEAMEEEDLMDELLLDLMEEDFGSLRDKMTSYDRMSVDFVRPVNDLLSKFLSDADFITKPAPSFVGQEGNAEKLDRILNVFEKSRIARTYLDFMEENKIRIIYSDQVPASIYDRESGIIMIHPALDETVQILLLAKEVRHMWQHKNGSLIRPLDFYPDQAVLVHRAQIVDTTLSMIRIAWELQLAGHKETWKYIENSPLSDLGRTFAREACADFRSLENGLAASSAFESWFLSDRCRQHDRELIQQMLSDYKGYIFDKDEESSKIITMKLMQVLGKMPYGKNYLADHAHLITNDPVFCEVRDRSNANFLWFIKFEHSFREAEQELQNAHGVSRHSHDCDVSQKLTDKNHEQPTPTNVISLPCSRPSSERVRSSASAGEIIYLQPWFRK